jgi:hypothetical protein
MPKDTVVKGYLFEVFDFEEFSKEKRFITISAEDKYKWDRDKREVTDEWEGVEVVVEVAEDNYDYSTDDDTEEIGLNLGTRFSVIIPDGDLEDIRKKYIVSRLSAPVLVDINAESSFIRKQKNRQTGTLTVIGTISKDNSYQSTNLVDNNKND